MGSNDNVYSWVTGSLLSSYIGKPVSFIAQFMSLEAGGKFIKLRLTDDSVIMATAVVGVDSFRREGWIFARGTVENRNKIRLESAYQFPEEMTSNFDKTVYNEAVQIFVEDGQGILTVDRKDCFEHFGTDNPNGEGFDLISTETSGPAPNGSTTNNNSSEMHFDEFNGSMW